jgi:N-methylhydantoinase A
VQIYAYGDENADLEILDLRVTAIGISPKQPPERLQTGNIAAMPQAGRRDVFVDGRSWPAAIYQREQLLPGFTFAGPAVVEQFDTTVFVIPGWQVRVDPFGNLLGTSTSE